MYGRSTCELIEKDKEKNAGFRFICDTVLDRVCSLHVFSIDEGVLHSASRKFAVSNNEERMKEIDHYCVTGS